MRIGVFGWRWLLRPLNMADAFLVWITGVLVVSWLVLAHILYFGLQRSPATGSRYFRNSMYFRIVPGCIKTTLCELSAYVR